MKGIWKGSARNDKIAPKSRSGEDDGFVHDRPRFVGRDAYFQDEPAAREIQEILTGAHKTKAPLLMTVINAGEVWYTYFRRASEKVANERIHQLRLVGVEFIEPDWSLAKAAARPGRNRRAVRVSGSAGD